MRKVLFSLLFGLWIALMFVSPVLADFDNPGFEVCMDDGETPANWTGTGWCWGADAHTGTWALDISGRQLCQAEATETGATYRVTLWAKYSYDVEVTVDEILKGTVTGNGYLSQLYVDFVAPDTSSLICFRNFGGTGVRMDDVGVSQISTPTPTFTPTPTPTPTPTLTPTPTPLPTCPTGYIRHGGKCVVTFNDAWHVNTTLASVRLQSGELPAPLPVLPGVVDMPDLQLPYVNHSDWPTVADERDAVKILIRNRVNLLQQNLSNRYNEARLTVRSVRNTTSMVSEMVGNPMAVTAHTGERSVTLTTMAQEMAQSMEFAIGYARAVGSIGPMGLDLVFVFIGLGWLVFVNLITLLIRVIAWFVRMLGKVLESIWKLLILLLEVIRLIIAIIDLFWPF